MENTSRKYRSKLISRAKVVGFKQILPKPPKDPQPHTMAGYNKRLSNWLIELKVAESYG